MATDTVAAPHLSEDELRDVACEYLDRAIRDLRWRARYDLGADPADVRDRADLLDDLLDVRGRVDGPLSDDDHRVILTAANLVTMDGQGMSVDEFDRRRARRIREGRASRNAHRPTLTADEKAAKRICTPGNLERLAALNGSLIVDMDDTLISNEVLFARSRDELTRTCMQLTSDARWDEPFVRAYINKNDKALLGTYGFTPRRWYAVCEAMICAASDNAWDERLRTLAHDIADLALGVGEILPGVEQTLGALADAGVSMVLKTKGDLHKQVEKLEAHEFDRFFGDRIVIIDRKDQSTFAQVARRFGLRAPTSIGDSAKSDILPALDAGFDAVYIDRSALKKDAPESERIDVAAPSVPSFPHAVLSVLAA